MTLHQLLVILRARRRLASRIFGGVLLATIIITALWPPQYEASASVVVDVKADPATGTVNPDQLLTSYLATQVDVASSDRVARLVVKLLKYDQDPETRQEWQSSGSNGDFTAWAAESLRKKIVVTPSRDSSVITITSTAPDRKTAADLANAFVKAYVDTTIDLKVEPAKQYASWYADRSRDLQADLEAKQKRLSDYQAANGITATDEKVDIESSRLSDLSAAVTRAQEEYQKAASKMRQAETNPDDLPEVMQSPLIGSLKSDLALAESKQKDLATSNGVNYPLYKSAEAQVASLRARTAAETQNVLNSVRGDAQASLRQLTAAQAALEAQKKRVIEFKGGRDVLQVLQNDVLASQQALDYVSQRHSQSSLESQLQQTNVVPLTLAVEPPYRSSPIIRVDLAVGFMLAVLLAVGIPLILELNKPLIRAREDLRRVLDVPFLGAVRANAMEGAP
jgi:chain length determinant protein EpsF